MVADVIGQLARLDKSAGPEGKGLHRTAQAWAGGAGLGPPTSGSRSERTPGPAPEQSARLPTEPWAYSLTPSTLPSARTPQDAGRGPEGQDLFPQRSQT